MYETQNVWGALREVEQNLVNSGDHIGSIVTRISLIVNAQQWYISKIDFDVMCLNSQGQN